MCSIIGSFSKDKIIELAKLNEYRGTVSHSISFFDCDEHDFYSVQKNHGPLEYDFKIPKNHYCIIHQQAPTDEDSEIHPAELHGQYLWHNGLLKFKTIEALKNKYNEESNWDTYLLLRFLEDHMVPEGIDGSFACVFYDHSFLYFFRNEIAPMFYDSNGNISSTYFENSKPLPPNALYLLDPRNIEVNLGSNAGKFETVNNPYF